MDIKVVCVVGTGQMGAGISQVAAQAGYITIMRDVNEELTRKAYDSIASGLERQVAKGKLPASERDAILGRFQLTTELEAASQADIVVEAVPEKLEMKQKVFATLDEICKEETILASNTSSLPITKIASATKRPDRVIGTHFFYPVPVMKLLEIIRAYDTSDETYETTRKFGEALGKVIVVAKDFPGFLSTRIGMPQWNEAMYAYWQGMGTIEDIDTTMKLSLNHPMGPFELMDFIGLDSVLSIFNILYEGYGEEKYFPCPLLTQMVQAGHLGRKTGRGFYDYSQIK